MAIAKVTGKNKAERCFCGLNREKDDEVYRVFTVLLPFFSPGESGEDGFCLASPGGTVSFLATSFACR